MMVETKTVTVSNAPVEDLNFLRPYAAKRSIAGHSDLGDAAVMRFALMELAELKRAADEPEAP